MKAYRSRTSTHGRNMAGARALWRATGMRDGDFDKPIIAVVNSFTQFVPGHVHLKDIGQLVAHQIERAGGVAKEFNTIAVDDGIAMGHDGMLYSLPSREIIADSVEYMANAHCVDALVCISNCDKITPGMLMASLRLNLPTIFVSGGPMEAGKTTLGSSGVVRKLDLVDAMVEAVDPQVDDSAVAEVERSACPTCGSCSGMFTANSMNCLVEAMGLGLPGNGSLLATHKKRESLFLKAGSLIVDITKRHYERGDETVLPRSIVTFEGFENCMALDIAMGGSTNTVLHLLAAAHEALVPFTMKHMDALSRKVGCFCKVAPSSPLYHMEDVHRAGGVMAILGELDRAGHINRNTYTVHSKTLGDAIDSWDVMRAPSQEVINFYKAAPKGVRTTQAFSQDTYWETLDTDRESGCIRRLDSIYSKEGGLAVLYGNIAVDGCVVKTAGVREDLWTFQGVARVFESQESAVAGILGGVVQKGEVVIIRYEGPRGGPGMQEMLYPTSYLKSMRLDKHCALLTDGRFSGGTSGLCIGHVSPEASAGGAIALVKDGDVIHIDIPRRSINLRISEQELQRRRLDMQARVTRAFAPENNRKRRVSSALKSYAVFASSASHGAVRNADLIDHIYAESLRKDR